MKHDSTYSDRLYLSSSSHCEGCYGAYGVVWHGVEWDTDHHTCPGGAVFGRQTRDRKVASSTPGRVAIKSIQTSISPG